MTGDDENLIRTNNFLEINCSNILRKYFSLTHPIKTNKTVSCSDIFLNTIYFYQMNVKILYY